jgi:hypothetical protein
LTGKREEFRTHTKIRAKEVKCKRWEALGVNPSHEKKTLTSSRLLGNGGFLRPIEYFHFTAKIDWGNDQSVADFHARTWQTAPMKGLAVYQYRPNPLTTTHSYWRERKNERTTKAQGNWGNVG